MFYNSAKYYFLKGAVTLLNENLITNEEASRELKSISPTNIATGLLNLERILEHLKENYDEPIEFDLIKLSDDMLRKDFGARIKIMRKSLGLTQAQLAKKIGMTSKAIANYEQGIREPSLKNLIALSTILNVTTDWLIGRS